MAIQFPAYRHFEASRIAMNDAAMSLVVGLRLGGVLLDQAPALERGRHLPDLFGYVPDIKRLNRTAEDAAVLLRDSERHVAYMGIPFVLSVYHSLTVKAVRFLELDGKFAGISGTSDATIKLEHVHGLLAGEGGLSLPRVEVQMLDFVRQVRNRIVHYEGTPGSRLRGAYLALPKEARDLWERWTARQFTEALSDGPRPMELRAVDLTPALALTKRLGKAINGELGRTISRSLWAKVVIEDYRDMEPDRFRNRGMRLRRIRGLARHLYADLGLSDDELQVALREYH